MNTLYPIFLKLHQLELLIVGGGNVAEEKLHFILKNSPNAKISLVAIEISPKIQELANSYSIQLHQRSFRSEDVLGKDLVIAATDIPPVNLAVQQAAKNAKVLVNVADTPALCDFYLGSIVTKGNLKVAISSNGKSPTLAKRFRQLLEESLPEEIDLLTEQLHRFRNQLKGDFEAKVKALNELTASLVS
ncbi:MAG: bifunctional precorrin-2 dehydrogenase/sirohydrochlorin ferrochelatase [Saprospiraceae bacterium]|nr:bifunctional precorrin-2 dehydrogenase/sirohydrochlorin ferrochelatase [Saprospiraceae bacterium]